MSSATWSSNCARASASPVMRLFVGLDFPDPIKTRLLDLQTSIPGVRWASRQQLHLTLFFIGETEKNQAVQAALERIKAESFALALSGIGRFPQQPKAPPRVLWAGVAESPGLDHLQQQISAALVDAGFKADERGFHPHVALARLKSGPAIRSRVAEFMDRQRDFEIEAVPVERFILFSSQLTPGGAIYQHEAVYPLH